MQEYPGILWFDNDPGTTLVQKIQKAMVYYYNKIGVKATICQIHPKTVENLDKMALQEIAEITDITIVQTREILPNHFWLKA